MITSKLTSKAQTTIPQSVRIPLGMRLGHALAYSIEGGRAILTRYEPASTQDDPFTGFSEWAGEADSKAYGGL